MNEPTTGATNFQPPAFDYQAAFRAAVAASETFLNEARIKHDEFQNKQLADAIVQAIQCGDITRLIVQGSTEEAVVYIPFQREHELVNQLEAAKRIMNAQELRLRELGDDPSEAVAVIGEPVHPAFHERDEATRDAKTLANILRSEFDYRPDDPEIAALMRKYE